MIFLFVKHPDGGEGVYFYLLYILIAGRGDISICYTSRWREGGRFVVVIHPDGREGEYFYLLYIPIAGRGGYFYLFLCKLDRFTSKMCVRGGGGYLLLIYHIFVIPVFTISKFYIMQL